MARRFDRCILHIGTEKTGTTTLQTLLAVNRDALLSRGYFVPQSLCPDRYIANHQYLATYALDTAKLHDDLRIAAGLRSEADAMRHRVSLQHQIRAEFAGNAGRSARTLLISNEHCHSRLTQDDEVARLKVLLDEYVEQFVIVVYLRPQHEVAASLYDQALRLGLHDIDLMPKFGPERPLWVDRRYFDYADLTSRWARTFGAPNLQVRIYARNELRNGSVTDDFLHLLQCDMRHFLIPQDANESIGAEFQPVLQAVNRLAMSHPDEVSWETRARLVRTLRRVSKATRIRATRADAMAFFHSFDDSNEMVRANFFPGRRSLFQPEFTKFPDSLNELASEQEALVRTILHLLPQ